MMRIFPVFAQGVRGNPESEETLAALGRYLGQLELLKRRFSLHSLMLGKVSPCPASVLGLRL